VLEAKAGDSRRLLRFLPLCGTGSWAQTTKLLCPATLSEQFSTSPCLVPRSIQTRRFSLWHSVW